MKEIKDHKFFASIDWEKLMAMELQPPFEPDLDAGKPSRQPAPKDQASTSQLDFFCQMVDYMKTSMSMRTTWPLTVDDQKIFENFDYVSNIVFEEDLTKAFNERADSFGLGGLDLGAGASAKR